MNGLTNIIPELDKRFRYAVEVRDSLWFQDLAYSFLQITIYAWSGVNLSRSHSLEVSAYFRKEYGSQVSSAVEVTGRN